MATAKLALKNGTYSALIGVNGTPASEIPFNIPNTLGTSGMVLTTDGSGDLIWAFPMDTITGTFTFSNGITAVSEQVKLGGPLLTGTDTIVSIPYSVTNTTTSFNVSDLNNTTFKVSYGHENIDNKYSSIQHLRTGVLGMYNTSTVLNATNELLINTIRQNAYDQGGNVATPFGHTNGLVFTSNAYGNSSANRSRLTYSLNSSESSGGTNSSVNLGFPSSIMTLYDSTSNSSNSTNIFNSVSGLTIGRYYTGTNNLFSSVTTKIPHVASNSTTYTNLGSLVQRFIISSTKKNLGSTLVTVPANHITIAGDFTAEGNTSTSTSGITTGAIYFEDNVNRVKYQTSYPTINNKPIDIVLDATIGVTAYDKSVFKVDLTSNGENYVFDTYPILSSNRASYSSVNSGNIFTLKNNGTPYFKIDYLGQIGINVTSTTVGGGYFLPNTAPSSEGRFLTYGQYKSVEWNPYIRMISNALHVTGPIVARTTSSMSDISLKSNIIDLDEKEAYDKILKINPKEYVFKDDLHTKHFGMIAQELESVLPELVNETDGLKSINYTEIIPLLISAIKYINSKI